MIKKILVALDPDTDTPVAIRYAAEIAQRHGAELTGLALVDMQSIQADSRGGGIGTMYLMEQVQENLTVEARTKAQELVTAFDETVQDLDIRANTRIEEGAPYERILEELKYQDLLVVGKTPHFFYSHPKKETKTLDRVVKAAVAPTLVVGNRYRPIHRVLLAYDGSDPSARTLQRFVTLQPFGTDLSLEILTVYPKGKREAAELMLRMVKAYADAHGCEAKTTAMSGNQPSKEILRYATSFDADLIVAGAHSVSKLKEMAFGSTTASLIKDNPTSLFLHN